MKKTGILTYHAGYNYGASLQAYALEKMINLMGKPVEIINYETDRFVASREMFSRKIERPKEIVKIISRIPYAKALKKRQQLFDDFSNNTLKVSPRYKSELEVIHHIDEYDCIVCGSDQIWNISGQDPQAENLLYFLNFEKNQKRISYAASFGTKVEKSVFRENEYLPWIRKFDYISVRETNAKTYLKSKGIDSVVTLDPTLLLDKENYDEICADRLIDHPYLLMFGWKTNHNLIKAAKTASKYYGLPVYNIVPPPRGMFNGIKKKLDVGPKEYLSMIKYADFVVTNSFHGTAFSVIYEKSFISVLTGKPDERITSMLEQLGLGNRFCYADNINFASIQESDYRNVKKSKEILRKSSKDFLKNALGVSADD